MTSQEIKDYIVSKVEDTRRQCAVAGTQKIAVLSQGDIRAGIALGICTLAVGRENILAVNIHSPDWRIGEAFTREVADVLQITFIEPSITDRGSSTALAFVRAAFEAKQIVFPNNWEYTTTALYKISYATNWRSLYNTFALTASTYFRGATDGMFVDGSNYESDWLQLLDEDIVEVATELGLPHEAAVSTYKDEDEAEGEILGVYMPEHFPSRLLYPVSQQAPVAQLDRAPAS